MSTRGYKITDQNLNPKNSYSLLLGENLFPDIGDCKVEINILSFAGYLIIVVNLPQSALSKPDNANENPPAELPILMTTNFCEGTTYSF